MAEVDTVRELVLERLRVMKNSLEKSDRGRLSKQYIGGSKQLGEFVELIRRLLGKRMSRRVLSEKMHAVSGDEEPIHDVTLYRVAKGTLGLDLTKLNALIELVKTTESLNDQITCEKVEAVISALDNKVPRVVDKGTTGKTLNRTILRLLSQHDHDPPMRLLQKLLDVEAAIGLPLDEALAQDIMRRWDEG